MTDDIVNDLAHALVADQDPWDATLYQRAIEEIKRLRAAGDTLHAAVRDRVLHDSHLSDWEEARRG